MAPHDSFYQNMAPGGSQGHNLQVQYSRDFFQKCLAHRVTKLASSTERIGTHSEVNSSLGNLLGLSIVPGDNF
jgi:hypothetical protein